MKSLVSWCLLFAAFDESSGRTGWVEESVAAPPMSCEERSKKPEATCTLSQSEGSEEAADPSEAEAVVEA